MNMNPNRLSTAKPNFATAFFALLAMIVTASAQTPVAITNSGFENPVLTDGNLSSGAIPGWSAFNGGTLAVLNPSSDADLTAEAPEGQNVGLITSSLNEDGMSQTLSAQFQADTPYTLTVKVANSKISGAFPGYRVQLAAGGTILAEEDNAQAVAEDAVITVTLNYTYNAGLHAGVVGQALEIRLLSKGLISDQEIIFDDIKLTLSLPNPVAMSGGPYTVLSGTSLVLDGSGSLPSAGATITAYDWDLNNDDTFGDATGATPAAITYADLASIWGMGPGANTIKLRVTDSAAKTAVITTTVNRQLNATLSSLVPAAGILTPAFDSGTTSYTALVPYATSTIAVTPTAANALAAITVNGNTVASGSASAPITLSLGSNIITIVVTGEDSVTTKTYTLTVTRDPNTNGTWSMDSDGLWNAPANWISGAIAQGPGLTATLGNFITADRTINLDVPITIGNITASDSSHNYTISGANSLTLDRTDTTRPNINVTASGRTLTIASEIAGTDGFQKTGQGTLTLSGANSISGSTSISGGGKLILNYNTNDNRKLPDNSALSLGGGTIVLKDGTATENFTQGTSSYFSTDAGTFFVRDGGTAKINLNAFFITSSSAQSIGRFSVVSFSHDNMATTDRPNTAGILGAWFTVGNRWAANSDPAVFPAVAADGNIVGYTGATTFGGASNSLDINYDLVGGFTMTSARSVNTLRIESNANDQVLNLGANTLSMSNHGGTNGTGGGTGIPANLTGSAGGLLYAGGANGNYTINGTGSLRLENQNGQAMLVNVYTGTLTVNATIGSGSSAFIKSGEGTLVLGGLHSNSGAFRIYQGVVRVKSNAAFGNNTGAASVQNGAALELDGAAIASTSRPLTITGTGISNGGALRNVATSSSYAPAITIGTGGARINSDASGVLTLTGGIVTAGNTVTFGGAGNTTVATAAISGTGGLIKDGAGITILSASNTYSDATSINAGTLIITGATQSTSAITFGGGVLGLHIASPVTAASATIDFSGQSVLVNGTPTLPSYTLLTANSITGTNPVLAAPAPAGYELDVVGNELRLVKTVVSSAYGAWATAKGLTGGAGSSTDPAKAADPDKDGKNNLQEFAFDGDPLSATNDGKVVGRIATVQDEQVLTLTLPVRDGATFGVDSGDQVSTLIDGIIYRIEGDVDLNSFAGGIVEVTPAITAGLPTPLTSGWTYRTFRAPGTVPTVPKAFLRAKISE